jgi:hypothetical protein
MSRLSARIIRGDEIEWACHLLHDVYFKEMKWDPPEGNPSALKAIPMGPKIGLTDLYTQSSMWFGAFDGAELVGCIRLLQPVEGRLEVENYRKVPLSYQAQQSRTREVNRLALRENYRSGLAIVHLIREVIKCAKLEKIEYVVTAVSMPEPAGLIKKLGFVDAGIPEFKYAAGDARAVNLYALDCRNGATVEKILTLCDGLIGGP